MTIAEKLRLAKEGQGQCLETVRGLLKKFEDNTWNATTDQPLLDSAQRSLDAADIEVRDLGDKLAMQQRTAPQGGPAQPVSVNVITDPKKDTVDQARKDYRFLRAVNLASQGRQLDGLEGEMQAEALKEARDSGISMTGSIQVPGFLNRSNTERRALSAGTTTEGGYTIQTDVGQLIPILEPRLVTRNLGATYLSGLVGNIDFPRNNGDASAAWEGEVTDADETTPSFDRVQMSPKRLAAFTTFSKQVAMQSSIDVENFVRRRLNFAIGKAVDVAAINGSGSSNQPTGVLVAAGTNSIAIGTNGGPLTWALVVKFETETATDDADFGRLAYLTTPGAAGALKTTEKASSTGQFIWTGMNQGAGQVNGYNALVSTLVPSTLTKGSSSGVCHAAVFGNWEDLLIGQWAGLDVVIDNITLAGKAQVKVIANSWWDIAIRRAASFCVCKDITV